MIIDCHGHFTTEPQGHRGFRDLQVHDAADARAVARPLYPSFGDQEIYDAISSNQLRLLRERGADITLFSPRAAGMDHHRGDETSNRDWARHCNDLIHRVVTLFPDNFVGVCQLAQTPQGGVQGSIAELRRCVTDLGFVGCNLNPDPSGGYWTAPPLTDPYWYPLFEVMVELDVPAMIHVSGSCNPGIHTTGAHYINADTAVFMQLLQGSLFTRFPTLRFVIPHGGGAVPYHWGRYRGLAQMLNKPPLSEHLMQNVFFDTCVYHQKGIDLLLQIIDVDNILFGSEMLGAVRATDPQTGFAFDDTRRYIESVGLSTQDKAKIYEKNVRRVYPRLDRALQLRAAQARTSGGQSPA